MKQMQLFLAQLERWSIPQVGRVSVAVPFRLWTAGFITRWVARDWLNVRVAWLRDLFVCVVLLFRHVRHIIHRIRKFGWGFRKICRSSPVVQHIVYMACGEGCKWFDHRFVFHDATGYTHDESFRLGCSTCRYANGGIGLPISYQVLDGLKNCGVELHTDRFVIPKEACLECLFHHGVDLLAKKK